MQLQCCLIDEFLHCPTCEILTPTSYTLTLMPCLSTVLLLYSRICSLISCETSTLLFFQHFSPLLILLFSPDRQPQFTTISSVLQPISLNSLPLCPKCPHCKTLFIYLPSFFLYSNCWLQLKKIIQHCSLMSHGFQSQPNPKHCPEIL